MYFEMLDTILCLITTLQLYLRKNSELLLFYNPLSQFPLIHQFLLFSSWLKSGEILDSGAVMVNDVKTNKYHCHLRAITSCKILLMCFLCKKTQGRRAPSNLWRRFELKLSTEYLLFLLFFFYIAGYKAELWSVAFSLSSSKNLYQFVWLIQVMYLLG